MTESRNFVTDSLVTSSSKFRRVTLLIHLSEGLHAGLIRGIGRYMQANRGWVVHRRDANVQEWSEVVGRPTDGVIACLRTKELHEAVAAMGVPVVNVCGIPGEAGKRVVEPDYAAIGSMMCRHLTDRGHHGLAFYGNLRAPGRSEVLEAARREAAGLGLTVSCFDRGEWSHLSNRDADEQFGDWLEALPKPLGLMTAGSEDGICAIQRCHERNFDIPEHVSLVGLATEEAFMDLSYPPLSSVQVAWPRLGYEAARRMDALLDGATDLPLPVPQPPSGLTLCRSSEVTAIADPNLAAALVFIHEHAGRAIPVNEVVRVAGLSRSALERRFVSKLGRTVFQEIRDQQIAQIRDLLLDSNLTLDEICDRSAFANTGHLSNAFRQAMGESPGRFRRRFQSP